MRGPEGGQYFANPAADAEHEVRTPSAQLDAMRNALSALDALPVYVAEGPGIRG